MLVAATVLCRLVGIVHLRVDCGVDAAGRVLAVGFDPAVASPVAPFVSTLVDVTGLRHLFSAWLPILLHGTLL